MSRSLPGLRTARLTALLGTLGLLTAAAVASPNAVADTAPPVSGTPRTVSADALPTWQVDGVVRASVTVGNTVYVTGSFTAARPPGVAVGGAGEVPAKNIFAFDIRTGARVASFSHGLNGQGWAIAASPDGARVYVGGDFTTVDGATRTRLAAFDTATGALVGTWKPSASGRVRAMTVIAGTNPTVFVGGSFTKVNGTARSRLAALGPKGGLRAWAPKADANVWALTTTPDATKVVVGGHFTSLAGAARQGLGAVDTVTGASKAWPAELVIRDAGPDSAITSLTHDGTLVYGTGYSFQGGGNFEGNFALTPTGRIVTLNDCLGDNYDAFVVGRVVYVAGHSHDCSTIGSFKEQTPRVWQRAMAFTNYATGTVNGPNKHGFDFTGQPSSSVLHWFPKLTAGTFTGTDQAAWTVTGNASYLVYGGEFPAVNGVAQQGLVRFAIPSKAPLKVAPTAATSLTPTVTAGARGPVLSWTATWDKDNRRVKYAVLRDGVSVGSFKQDTAFWNLPGVAWTDTTATVGNHSYRVVASDPDGNTTNSSSVPFAVGAAPQVPVWTPVAGAVSAYTTDPRYQAAVTSSNYAGDRLNIAFTATGPSGSLPRPEASCVRITRPNGTRVTLAPFKVVLTKDASGAYTGTLTYWSPDAGSVTLQYACASGFSRAQVGSLG